MKIIQINGENIAAFEGMMTLEAACYLRYSTDTLGYGIDNDGKAGGSLVIRLLEDGRTELMSVFVVPELRRRGYATELFYNAVNVAEINGNHQGIFANYITDVNDSQGINAFLRYFDAEITEKAGERTYLCTLGDIKNIPVIKKSDKRGVISYNELSNREKNSLIRDGNEMLPLYMQAGCIDGDVSCFIRKDSRLKACLIMNRRADGLTLDWVRISKSEPLAFMKLIRYGIDAMMGKYPDELQIKIPTINLNSAGLTEKLFKDSAKIVEKSYKTVIQ